MPEIKSNCSIGLKATRLFWLSHDLLYDDPAKWTEMPIAQFEYNESSKSWSLFGYNRNSRRVPYSKGNLEKLLQYVNKDLTGIIPGDNLSNVPLEE